MTQKIMAQFKKKKKRKRISEKKIKRLAYTINTV